MEMKQTNKMKNLETIYKEQSIEAKAQNTDGIDYRSHIEITYEGIYEFVTKYLQDDNNIDWNISDAISEFLYMDLTDYEKIVATKCLIRYFEHKGRIVR